MTLIWKMAAGVKSKQQEICPTSTSFRSAVSQAKPLFFVQCRFNVTLVALMDTLPFESLSLLPPVEIDNKSNFSSGLEITT